MGGRSTQAAGAIAGATIGAGTGAGAGAGVGAGEVPAGHLLQVDAQYPPAGAPPTNMKLALHAPYAFCSQPKGLGLHSTCRRTILLRLSFRLADKTGTTRFTVSHAACAHAVYTFDAKGVQRTMYACMT